MIAPLQPPQPARSALYGALGGRVFWISSGIILAVSLVAFLWLGRNRNDAVA